jgi:phosphohistidine phosphatase
MIKRLWILRHGEAERHTQRDAERQLTVRGEADARAVGEYLATIVSSDLRVLASPYRRAQQTAQNVLLAFPSKSLTTHDWLTPDDDPLAAIDELAKLHDSEVLLVSHQPLVSALAGMLADGDYRAGPPMGTASLAELELSMVAPGCARLVALRHAPDYRISAL